MLGGVRFAGEKVETHSMVLRSYSGTIRWIDAVHDLQKLRARTP
jgi:fructose-1,6-bisphosphatase II